MDIHTLLSKSKQAPTSLSLRCLLDADLEQHGSCKLSSTSVIACCSHGDKIGSKQCTATSALTWDPDFDNDYAANSSLCSDGLLALSHAHVHETVLW